MFKFFKIRNLLTDQSGAVTVDWVVLTASITVIAIVSAPIVISGVFTVASNISDEVETSNNF